MVSTTILTDVRFLIVVAGLRPVILQVLLPVLPSGLISIMGGRVVLINRTRIQQELFRCLRRSSRRRKCRNSCRGLPGDGLLHGNLQLADNG